MRKIVKLLLKKYKYPPEDYYTAISTVFAEYEQLSNRYSLAQMLLLLEKQSPELPEGYRKVWRSYCSVRDAVLADNDTKELIHRRVLELQEKRN